MSLVLLTQDMATLLSVHKLNQTNENNELRCFMSLHPINVEVSSSFGIANLFSLQGATPALGLLMRILLLRVLVSTTYATAPYAFVGPSTNTCNSTDSSTTLLGKENSLAR